jgi:hypothetical protein
VRSRELPANRVIAVRNGFLSLYREYPSGRVEITAVVHICGGAEDGLIEAVAKAFKKFDKVWNELLKKSGRRSREGLRLLSRNSFFLLDALLLCG